MPAGMAQVVGDTGWNLLDQVSRAVLDRSRTLVVIAHP